MKLVEFSKFISFINKSPATTRRVRPSQQDVKTTRKRNNTQTRRKNSTARRGSQYHEVQVSMLPDLSGLFYFYFKKVFCD